MIQLPSNIISQINDADLDLYLIFNGSYSSIGQADYITSLGFNIPTAVYDYIRDNDFNQEQTYETDYPPAVNLQISRTKFAVSKPKITFTISGSYLNPYTEITSDLLTIDSVTFVSSQKISVTINTLGLSQAGTGTVFINGRKLADITTFISNWVDLRSGGAALGALELRSITTAQVIRDANGIGSDITANGWSKLLAIPSLSLNRDHSAGFQMVYKIQSGGSGMFGMIASGHGNDTSMYNETHVGFYVSNQNTLWGFYSYANSSNNVTISSFDRLKIVFPSTMSPGSDFIVYGLQSGDSWDNEDNPIYDGTVPTGTQDAGDTVYPCITTSNAVGARLQSFNPIYSG